MPTLFFINFTKHITIMDRATLDRLRAKGFQFDNRYDELADIEKKNYFEKDEIIKKRFEEEENIIEKLGHSKNNGKANGYYFNLDGTFFGKEGTSSEVVICTKKIKYTYLKNNKKEKGFSYLSPNRTAFEYSDIEIIAGIIYAESSVEHIKDFTETEMLNEAYALGTTMMNFKYKRKHDDLKNYNPSYTQLSVDMKAYGYNSPNYNKFINEDLEKRNNNHMRVCIGASINSLFYNNQLFKKSFFKEVEQLEFLNSFNTMLVIKDFSNNALFWDGKDIKSNYDKHPKILDGYIISDELHNVLDIESKKVNDSNENEDEKKICNKLYSINDPNFEEIKCYSYKYKTTVGFCKTMFVKLTDEYENANINSRREKKENTYILNRWW